MSILEYDTEGDDKWLCMQLTFKAMLISFADFRCTD